MRTSINSLALAAALLLPACSTEAQSPQQGATDVVATVGGSKITLAQTDERAMKQVAGNFGSLTLGQAIYEARRGAVEELIGDLLVDAEAKARGVSRVDLLKKEIQDKVLPPSDIDVAAWYRAHPNESRSAARKVAEPIQALLLQERTRDAQTQFLDSLKAKTSVTISLEAPRLTVADAGRPSRGPENAPIQIIEFSDFQCPFCFQAHPTVSKVLSNYGDKIRFVYRHYPLPNHPNARPAAEAAACAAEQDRFWQYHDRLFENQSKLSASDLKHAAAPDWTPPGSARVDARKAGSGGRGHGGG